MNDISRSSAAGSTASQTVPVHVGIIMDGNGRWATRRRLPRVAGHRKGAEAVRRIVEAAADLGVRYLTLFGFSSENWSRPALEVQELMSLLRSYLRSEVAELNRTGIRLRIIGDRSRLARDILDLIDHAESTTAHNTRMTLIIALSYGARQELIRAAQRLAQAVQRGEVVPEAIDEGLLAGCLDTAGIPDPDLIIRTSGEKRLSNFLLWQSAYAELVFTETLWPDFSRADLEAAFAEFRQRERRYGATSPAPS